MTMVSPLSFFQWGAGGKALTPDDLQKMRLLEAQRAMQGDTRPADTPAQGLARVAEALAGSFRRGQLDSQAEELAAHDQSRIASWGNTSDAGSGAAVPAPDVAASLMAQPANVSTGSTYEPFMQTVQQGVNNPYALAAIAATGQAESGFSPANANRVWNDPSQSGQAGQSGGIMSWRNERLGALQNYAAQAGEQPGAVSPQTQAQFFLRENPQLIERLNNARSVEEAQRLMNDSWRFAGYNQPGGEADKRLQVARALLPQFQGGQSAPAQGGYNTQALLDTAVDPRVSEQTRSVAQALLKQQQARDAAALQLQQRQAAAQSAGIDPRFAADDELWKQAAAAQFRQAPQSPASVQEYEYYRSQAGQNALPYDQWDQARRRSGATNVTQNTSTGTPLTPGQRKVDELFADTYVNWMQSGAAEAQKNIAQLSEAITLLESGKGVTGLVGLLPEKLQAFVNPDGSIARNNVESVVQLTLKEILGGQFAQKEGEQVLARAFNPLLPPEENARRVKRLLEVVSSMAASKQVMADYFSEHGTLQGYDGTRPTMGQFVSLADEFKDPEDRPRRRTLIGDAPSNDWTALPNGARVRRIN